MTSLISRSSSVSQALELLNKAAENDTSGTGQAHLDLLESIRVFTLVVEKPNETLTRHRLEVGTSNQSSSSRSIKYLLG